MGGRKEKKKRNEERKRGNEGGLETCRVLKTAVFSLAPITTFHTILSHTAVNLLFHVKHSFPSMTSR